MKWFMIKNDLKRNKTIHAALLLFIIFSAALATLSVIMAVQTIASINELYGTAQPPHFLQMHKGEMNQDEIDAFMKEQEEVTDWQTVAMINVYGEELTVVNNEKYLNLSDCRLDIGMVKQNTSKDLLLNAEHEKVILQEGEIGMPVLLKEMYDMDIGDHIILNSNEVKKEFVIKEFILDSQMNSSMCSSTRILLSDSDYEALKDRVGEKEYLIEVYLTNTDLANTFQTAYENAKLPQNGQAVTYTMIFLMSAFTDITTVFVLILVSILLVFVALICIKFTILAALEEEMKEIGTMKAIGIPFADIRALYLGKYRVLAFTGVFIGYLIVLLTNKLFTQHIHTTFGSIRISPLALVASAVAAYLVFLLITFYCKRILKKIKGVTVVDTLVTGKGFERKQGKTKDGMYKSKILPVNWLLGIREVFFHFKNWIIIFTVSSIAVFMIMISINLVGTFQSPEFITYMGCSPEDILIEIDNGVHLETGYQKVKQVLDESNVIQQYYESRRVRVHTTNSEKKPMNLHIDCGEHEGNGLQYLHGRTPQAPDEIAISYLNAREIDKKVGDTIMLFYASKEKEFIISGIYQDVTSGGYTAKSKYNFPELNAEKYAFSVDLNDATNVEQQSKEWSKIIGTGVSIDPMEEFSQQTLGGVVQQLMKVVITIVIIASLLTILITVLFLKLRLAKEQSEIAILKAIGFSETDIRIQYMIKTGYVSLLGLVTGIVLGNVLGERIVNTALQLTGFGITKIDFIINPFVQYFAYPILLLGLILLVVWTVMSSVKKIRINAIVNE